MRAAPALLLVCLGCLSATGTHAADPPKADPVVLQWEVNLADAYNQNEAAADDKYTDKLVEFVARGRVKKDGKEYLIVCEGGGAPLGVVCRMDAQDTKRLASAKVDDTFPAYKVRGVCAGKKGGVVTVKDCRLVCAMFWDGKEYKEQHD